MTYRKDLVSTMMFSISKNIVEMLMTLNPIVMILIVGTNGEARA